MCHPLMLVFSAVLFFVLTPGIFLSLPAGGTKYTKAAVHAVVFAVVFYLTYKLVLNYLYGNEGFAAKILGDPSFTVPSSGAGNIDMYRGPPTPPSGKGIDPLDKDMLRACNKATAYSVNSSETLKSARTDMDRIISNLKYYITTIDTMAKTCAPMANI